jgi:hypothetical protein
MIEAIDKASSWLDRFQGRWSRRIERIQDMLDAWKNELIRIEVKLGYREEKYVPAWKLWYDDPIVQQALIRAEDLEELSQEMDVVKWRRYGPLGKPLEHKKEKP